jgi:mono/diheme cytochrome c family protein
VVTNPSPGGGASNAFTFGVATASATLSGTVQPIFTASCASSSCHSDTTAAGGLRLTGGKSFSDLVGVRSACTPLRVVACGPLRSQSVLIDKLLASVSSPPCRGTKMPKTGTLSNAQIQAIVDWVAAGAKND